MRNSSSLSNCDPMQLQQSFWKVKKTDSLTYYLDLNKLISETGQITLEQANTCKPCKYCKAYPFNVCYDCPEPFIKQCQLCESINQYPVRQYLWQTGEQFQWYKQYSYCHLTKDVEAMQNRCAIVLDIGLIEESLELVGQSLCAVLPQQKFKIAILVIIGDRLGILEFGEQEVSLIYVNKDIELRQIIEQYCINFDETKSQQLLDILAVFNQQPKCKVVTDRHIKTIISSYDQKRSNRQFNCLVWIGRIPQTYSPIPRNSLYIVAVLINSQQLSNANLFVQYKCYFNQLHLVGGKKQPTLLYYKIYQIFSSNHFNCLITSPLHVKTNFKYSGTMRNNPNAIINSISPIIQIQTSSDKPHKLQVYFEYYHVQFGRKYQIVINLEDYKPKVCKLFQRTIVINKILLFIIQKYFQLWKGNQNVRRDFDFFFIVHCIKEFGQKYENKTNFVLEILSNVERYFKQFQKNMNTMFSPFLLTYRPQVIYIFHPLYTSRGLLHFYSGYYSKQQQSSQIQGVNEIMELIYSSRKNKIPIYYRICLEEDLVLRFQEN